MFVSGVLGINHPRDFWFIWNCPHFTRAIWKFPKIRSGSLSKIVLPSMRLLVLSESKLGDSVLPSELLIDNYDTLA